MRKLHGTISISRGNPAIAGLPQHSLIYFELSGKTAMNDVTMIAEKHFSNVKEASMDKVILSDEVRQLCEQNRCGRYGKSWVCPPAIKSIDEYRTEISQFESLVVVYNVYGLEDSFDWEGMMAGISDFRERLLSLKKELENECSQSKFLLLGAGSCRLCEQCAYVDGEACRRPDDVFISVEGCGIDVMRLMRDSGLNYNNGPNTVTYIGGIMY